MHALNRDAVAERLNSDASLNNNLAPVSHPDMPGPGTDMRPAKVVLETEGVVSAEVASIPGILHQDLHPDGQPRRPMNAFMIFARHRRPAIQAKEPGLKTGDISKRLSHDWKNLETADKAHYLQQAKILKDEFQSRFPDYVYKRRPNNAASGRRKSSISLMVAEKGGSSSCLDERPTFMGSNELLNPTYRVADNPHALYRPTGQDAYPSMYDRRDQGGYHARPPSAPIRANGAVGFASAQSQSPSPFSPHDSTASSSVPPQYGRLPQTSNLHTGGPPSPSPYWFNAEDSFGSSTGPPASGAPHSNQMGGPPSVQTQPPLAASYSHGRAAFVGSWPEHKPGQANSQHSSPMSSMPPTPAYPTHPQTSPQPGPHGRTQSLNCPAPMYRQSSPQYAQSRHRQTSAPDLHAYGRTPPGYEALYEGRRPDIPEDPQQQQDERDLPPLHARPSRFASQGRLLPPDLYPDYAPPAMQHHGGNSHCQPPLSSEQHRMGESFSAPQPPLVTSQLGLPRLSHYSTSRGPAFSGNMGVGANGQSDTLGSGPEGNDTVAIYHPQPHAPGRSNLTHHLSGNGISGSNGQHSTGSINHYDRSLNGQPASDAAHRPSLHERY